MTIMYAEAMGVRACVNKLPVHTVGLHCSSRGATPCRVLTSPADDVLLCRTAQGPEQQCLDRNGSTSAQHACEHGAPVSS